MSTVDFNNSEEHAAETFEQNNEAENIVDKFKTYRLSAETREKLHEEAQTVINQLKHEANLSKDVEKNLTTQISSAQRRLTQLQSTLRKFIITADKQKQMEKTSHRVEQRVEELDKLVREAGKQARSLSEKIAKEIDFVKKNEETKLNLAAKNSEFVLMKAEIESLIKEKFQLKFEFESRVKKLEEDLKIRKRENAEMKSNYDETLLIYKKQIDDREKRIREYEKERKTLLEDFELPKKPDGNPEFTWADSTVSINPEEKSNTQNKEKDDEADIFCSSPSVIRSPLKRRKAKSSSGQKALSQRPREKPQLEFLTENQGPSTMTQNPPAVPAKRKLFSTNFNHYVNLCHK